MVWLVAPLLIVRHQGLLEVLGERDNTKAPGSYPSHWELMCSEFSVFERPGTPPKRAMKHEINLLPESVLPARS